MFGGGILMKYYKLMMDYNGTKKEDMVCYVEEGFPEKYGIDEYAIYDGKLFDEWCGDLTFYYNPLEGSIPNDYLATDIGWLIVSNRCRKILDEMDVNNVQYLPIKIKSLADKSEIKGYSVINIIGQVEALNLDSSVYSYFNLDDKKILNVIKYGLNKDPIKNLHIFRLKESKFSVFVSEDVKKAFKAKKINGFDFLQVRVV